MGRRKNLDDDWEIDIGNTPDSGDGTPPWEDLYRRKQKRAKKNTRKMRKKPPARLDRLEAE